MIVVTGATGKTGRHIVPMLVEKGVSVRAMTRDPERAKTMPGFDGAEVVHGDPMLEDPLAAAFAGAEKIYLVPPIDAQFAVIEQRMIAAARRAGVGHVVKLSLLELRPPAPTFLVELHRAGERALEASGMKWTHLRPGPFHQNITDILVPASRSPGTFQMCTGEGRVASIDARDIAEVAVHALTQPGHEGRVYELTGPELLSYADVAARISAVTGHTLRFEDMTASAYTELLASVGFPGVLASAVGELYGKHIRAGGYEWLSPTVHELLGRAPRSIDDFARDHVEALTPRAA